MSSRLSIVLKSLMHAHGLSEMELFRQTGVSQPVIHRLKEGKNINPKLRTLEKIAEHFKVSIDQLLGNHELPNDLAKAIGPRAMILRVPLIKMEQIPHWLDNHTDIDPLREIITDASGSEHCFAVQVQDSTLEPRFPAGTLFIVDPEGTPEDRDFVLVRSKDHTMPKLRQLFIDGKDHYLKPLNPDFPAQQLHNSDKILGTMMQARVDFA